MLMGGWQQRSHFIQLQNAERKTHSFFNLRLSHRRRPTYTAVNNDVVLFTHPCNTCLIVIVAFFSKFQWQIMWQKNRPLKNDVQIDWITLTLFKLRAKRVAKFSTNFLGIVVQIYSMISNSEWMKWKKNDKQHLYD